MNASLDTEKTKLNWIEIVHQPYQKEQEQHFPFIDVANLAFPLYKTSDSLRRTGHRTGKKGGKESGLLLFLVPLFPPFVMEYYHYRKVSPEEKRKSWAKRHSTTFPQSRQKASLLLFPKIERRKKGKKR